MIKEFRDELIVFTQGKVSGGYPKTVKAYNGELSRLKELAIDVPAVLVHLPEGDLVGKDALGKRVGVTHTVDFLLICVNRSGATALSDELFTLIDWMIDQLRGSTLTADGVIYTLAGDGIKYTTSLDDFGEVGLAVGIVTTTVKQVA